MALQQPQRGEVEHAVGASERLGEHVGLADVAAGFEHLDPVVAQRDGEVLVRATHEVVVDDDLADVVAQ